METVQAAPEYLSQAELLKVLSNCGIRERCMFLLGYGHGLRASEIAGLTLDNVKNGEIHCARGKKSEPCDDMLRDHEKVALAEWLRLRGEADGSQMLFTSRKGSGMSRQQVYNLFRKAAELASIKGNRVNPHILKHSYASHLLRNGADLAYVQRSLGHKHISSTVRYTHVTSAEAQVVSNRILDKVFAPAAA